MFGIVGQIAMSLFEKTQVGWMAGGGGKTSSPSYTIATWVVC